MGRGLSKECRKIKEIIERLARCEEINDEETTQTIIHTETCEACKKHLAESFNRKPFEKLEENQVIN